MFRAQSLRRGLLGLFCLAALACAPQTVVVWEKPGATDAELEEARRACLAGAESEDLEIRRDRIDAEVRGNAFVRCMEERGWVWKTEPAPSS